MRHRAGCSTLTGESTGHWMIVESRSAIMFSRVLLAVASRRIREPRRYPGTISRPSVGTSE